MLWLLAKSFARCKTSRASNTRHPIFNIYKRFFDSLTAPPYFLRRSGFMPCPVLTMPVKTDKPPSERRGQRCLYDMLCKLFQQCELADKGKLLSLSLCGIDDAQNHKHKSEDTAYCAYKSADYRTDYRNKSEYACYNTYCKL